MSKTSLFILAAIFSVLSLSLFIVLKTPQGWPNGLPWGEPSPSRPLLSPQENSGGEVDVKVAPLVLKVGKEPQFRLEFNTHSVELDFDVVKIASLTTDRGPFFGEVSWEGSPPGGHHREGKLSFADNLTKTKSVALILRDIAGITRREFTWSL